MPQEQATFTDQDRQQFKDVISQKDFLAAPDAEKRKRLSAIPAMQKVPEAYRGKITDTLVRIAPKAAAMLPPAVKGPPANDPAANVSKIAGTVASTASKVLTTPIPEALGKGIQAITGSKQPIFKAPGTYIQEAMDPAIKSQHTFAERNPKAPEAMKGLAKVNETVLSGVTSLGSGLANWESSSAGSIFKALPAWAQKGGKARKLLSTIAQGGLTADMTVGAVRSIGKAMMDPSPANVGEAAGQLALMVGVGKSGVDAARNRKGASTGKAEAPPEPKPSSMAVEELLPKREEYRSKLSELRTAEEYNRQAATKVPQHELKLQQLRLKRNQQELDLSDKKEIDATDESISSLESNLERIRGRVAENAKTVQELRGLKLEDNLQRVESELGKHFAPPEAGPQKPRGYRLPQPKQLEAAAAEPKALPPAPRVFNMGPTAEPPKAPEAAPKAQPPPAPPDTSRALPPAGPPPPPTDYSKMSYPEAVGRLQKLVDKPDPAKVEEFKALSARLSQIRQEQATLESQSEERKRGASALPAILDTETQAPPRSNAPENRVPPKPTEAPVAATPAANVPPPVGAPPQAAPAAAPPPPTSEAAATPPAVAPPAAVSEAPQVSKEVIQQPSAETPLKASGTTPNTEPPPVEQKSASIPPEPPKATGPKELPPEVAAARDRLTARLKKLGSALKDERGSISGKPKEPEFLFDGEAVNDLMTLGRHYFNEGAKNFGEWSNSMVEHLGDGFKPYLHSAYRLINPNPRVEEMMGGKVAAMYPQDIAVDPKRFQFKSKAVGKAGVSDKLNDVEYDPERGGMIAIWEDPANGKPYVVNGHHRLDLANRSGYSEKIPVLHLEAKNAAEARMKGALINLSEGQGEPIDAAKVFRDGKLKPEDLKKYNISPRSPIVKQGLALSKLPDNLFSEVTNGDFPEGRALAIAEVMPEDPAHQKAAADFSRRLDDSGQRMTDAEFREAVRLKVARAPIKKVKEELLWGTEEKDVSLDAEMGSVSEFIKNQLRSDKRVFGTLNRGEMKQRAGEAGNILAEDENARRAQQSGQAIELYDKLSGMSGPVSETLEQAARDLSDGANPKDVKQRAYERIREQLGTDLQSLFGSGKGSVRTGTGSPPKEQGTQPPPGGRPENPSSGSGAGEPGSENRATPQTVEEFNREAVAARERGKGEAANQLASKEIKYGKGPPIDAGKESIEDSPLFGGSRQGDMFSEPPAENKVLDAIQKGGTTLGPGSAERGAVGEHLPQILEEIRKQTGLSKEEFTKVIEQLSDPKRKGGPAIQLSRNNDPKDPKGFIIDGTNYVAATVREGAADVKSEAPPKGAAEGASADRGADRGVPGRDAVGRSGSAGRVRSGPEEAKVKPENGSPSESKGPVTKDQFAEARERVKARLKSERGSFSNKDLPENEPSLLDDLVLMGKYAYQEGTQNFKAWADQMIGEFGDNVRPILEGAWQRISGNTTSPRMVTVGNPPVMDTDNVPRPKSMSLFPNQEQSAALAIKNLESGGGYLEASGTGAGKTATIAATAKHFLDQGKTVVIAAPKNVWGYANDKVDMPGGSYGTWLKEFGITPTRVRAGVKVEPGKLYLTTYDKGQYGIGNVPVDKNTIVIADESHGWKNVGVSDRASVGVELTKKAGGVMFATATPADKPYHIAYLERMGILEGKSPAEAIGNLGMELVRFEHPKTGAMIETWQIRQGFTPQMIRQRFAKLFDRMIDQGKMRKDEIAMDNLEFAVEEAPLPKEWSEVDNKIQGAFGSIDELQGPMKAVVMGHLRRAQETFKIPKAMELAKKELAEGRKVVMFVSRVNRSDAVKRTKIFGFGGELVDTLEEVIHSSEGTAKILRQNFKDMGVKYAEIHGESEMGNPEAMRMFQSGEADVVVATAPSGGVGINLDDTKGTAPRTIIVMTPEFDAMNNVQLIGRVYRASTKSPAKVKYLFSDTDIDKHNYGILSDKIKLLQSIVKGESGKLDMSQYMSDDFAEDVKKRSGPEYNQGDEVVFEQMRNGYNVKLDGKIVRIEDDGTFVMQHVPSKFTRGKSYGEFRVQPNNIKWKKKAPEGASASIPEKGSEPPPAAKGPTRWRITLADGSQKETSKPMTEQEVKQKAATAGWKLKSVTPIP